MQHSLSPIDAGTGTVMRHPHTSGSQILVNIAHIGKVKFCVWNVKLHSMLPLRMTVVVAQSSLGVSDEQT